MGKADMDAIQDKIDEGEKAEKTEKAKKMRKKIKEKQTGFLKDFKKFITKGNVVDLAVAVILGTAFNAIVNGLVKMIINPLLAVFTDGMSLDNLKTVIVPEVVDAATGAVTTAEVAILWGQWIQTILDFFIIALTIFIIARVAHRATALIKYKELEQAKAEAAKKKAEEDAKANAVKEEAARREEALQNFYNNVEKQTALLEEMAKRER